MEKVFNQVCDRILNELKEGEHLSLSFGGENSQFIRLNGSKVRQTGLVDDASLGMSLIFNNRTTSSGFDFKCDLEIDSQQALVELNRLRAEIVQLPEDPYIVIPEDKGSSHEEHPGDLLPPEKAVSSLLPAMQGVDLAGIWASGRIFSGNANSAGQKHWFSTDTFSLDYSLITPDERMVKATFAGDKWDQCDYDKYMANSIKKLKMMELASKKIEPGNYRTFIASAGVADLVGMLSWGGVSEAAIQQGDSSLIKMRKENIRLSSLFSLTEDFRSGMVPRFNSDGEIAPENLALIANGKLENTLISTRTAKEYKLTSNNASGWEGLRSPVMEAGVLDEDDVLKELGTGVYLSNLHYLNWSDQIGGRITGMTRYACFWVEQGKIVAPIENMRFDDSIYNFWGDNLEAVTSRKHFIPETSTYEGREPGGTYCPGMLLNSFALTL